MSEEKPYQPSEEEIQKAEEMMTKEQMEMSKNREKGILDFYKKSEEAIFEIAERQKDLLKEIKLKEKNKERKIDEIGEEELFPEEYEYEEIGKKRWLLEQLRYEKKISYIRKSLDNDYGNDYIGYHNRYIKVDKFLLLLRVFDINNRQEVGKFLENSGIEIEEIKKGRSWTFVENSHYLDNPQEMKEWIGKNPFALKNAPKVIKDNMESVLEAMKGAIKQESVIGIHKHASNRLKNDIEFIKKAIEIDDSIFSELNLNPKFLDNKELAMLAIKENGRHLFDVSDRLKNDKEIVMEALKDCPILYWYGGETSRRKSSVISENLRKDIDIIELALNAKDRYNFIEEVVESIPEEVLKSERVKQIIEEAKNKITKKSD